MRIAFNGDSLDFQYAGVHYYVKNLVEQLEQDSNGQDIIIFTPNSSRKSTSPSIRYVYVPHYRMIPFFQFIRLFILMPYLSWRMKVDAFIEPAHFGPFNLSKRIKRVTVIHDLTPLLFPQWHTFRGRVLQKLFLPTIIKRADLILTNSEYTKADIQKHIGKENHKIKVAHLGVDKRFVPTTDLSILQKYGLNSHYMLYLGTIEPRKNVIRLIQCVSFNVSWHSQMIQFS